MRLTIRLLGYEWLSVDLERGDDVLCVDAACVACEDSGDDCVLCGAESVEVESE